MGHEEIARREEASSRLLKAGAKALPALLKARESKDPEKALRVRDLIAEIERPERERAHDARMRPQALGLVRLDFKEGKLSDVLAALEKQMKIRFLSALPPDTRVSIVAKDTYFRKCLDALEDGLDVSILEKEDPDIGRAFEISRGRFLRKPRAYLPGVTLDFFARSYRVGGEFKGLRVKARPAGESRPFIRAWEVRGADGIPRTVETCKICGTLLALVRCKEGEELRIRIKGTTLWDSRYELEVGSPASAQEFKVGPFRVNYEFPKVTISSAEEIFYRHFGSARLEGKFKEGIEVLDSPMGGRFAPIEGWGERGPGVWCDCPKDPKPVVVEAPRTRKSKVETMYEYAPYAASDFVSMKVVFYKPIEEPFEADVVIPAD